MTDDIQKLYSTNAESYGVSDTPHLSSFSSMTMIVNDGEINTER